MLLFYDPTYVLVLIGAVLSMIASGMVNTTFSRYSRVRSASGMTGKEAAERILHSQGIYDVSVNHVSGNLTDHYNPSNKQLNLSDATYASASVAAIGVAAHECGHAIQHAKGYAPLSIRTAIVPIANFGSRFSWIILIVGLIAGMNPLLIQIGLWMFVAVVAFQLVTLPVEINASRRAVHLLGEIGILNSEELPHTRKVLSAAALTYVAAATAAILQLIRLYLLFGGRRNDG